ncbi:Co-chaperone HscB, C-terminal oligomerization domain-containing protein [Phycomyces nitens]|nr:Co-chaperone HscB, C-terminal oligomerization domain-containing protein [Phycomyces nitens]
MLRSKGIIMACTRVLIARTSPLKPSKGALMAFPKPVMRTMTTASRPMWYAAHHENRKTCWKCEASVPNDKLHCDNTDCGVIQPVPSDINFFGLLDAGKGPNHDEPTYNVDTKALRRKFLRLQQKAHPDSYSQASKHEYSLAQTQSSVINKAYKTLLDPLVRAHYMLSLKGKQVSESESLQDPELLMDVMEFREELEDAETNEDVARLKTINDEKYRQAVEHISEAFENKDYELAKEYTIQLQYWEKIRRVIIDWSPGKRVEIEH